MINNTLEGYLKKKTLGIKGFINIKKTKVLRYFILNFNEGKLTIKHTHYEID